MEDDGKRWGPVSGPFSQDHVKSENALQVFVSCRAFAFPENHIVFAGTGGRFSQAAVPQSGIVERLCLKLPVVSLVE